MVAEQKLFSPFSKLQQKNKKTTSERKIDYISISIILF